MAFDVLPDNKIDNPSAMTMRIERVFPADQALNDDSNLKKDVVLSLLDATAANFSPTGAVWFLEKPNERFSSPANVVEHLRTALSTTLNAYPQWCGQLNALPYRPNEGTTHLLRLGRLRLSFGSCTDPGVELGITDSSASLDEWFGDRECSSPLRDMHQFPWDQLIPATQLAAPLSDSEEDIKPSLAIQITTLACGGTVLAVKMAHPLGDAHTLAHFVNDWSRIAKANITKAPRPSLSPIFQPALLDRQAAGNIDQPIADEQLIRRASTLPFHRYDWWAQSEGCPWPVTPPEPFRSRIPLKPAGIPMPWHEWDVTAPVSHYVFHFSAEQIQRLWDSASNGCIVPFVSRHDAVVAHVWSCINRARGINNNHDGEELVHCDLVYGVRERLSLGDDFLGSPLVMLDISAKASSSPSSTTDLGQLATLIRETIQKVSTDDIRAHLYSVAYEDSPQRLWQAFLGKRHILVTSWVQTDVYKVDFGAGMVPRYVEAIMPDLDGIVQVITGPRGGGVRDEEEEEAYGKMEEEGDRRRTRARKTWYRDGVNISVHICSDAMEKLLKDPHLFP